MARDPEEESEETPLGERADASGALELSHRRRKTWLHSRSSNFIANDANDLNGIQSSRNMRKKAPNEVSTHSATGSNLKLHQFVQPKKRDPRFDPVVSAKDQEAARKRMAFLYDEALPAEQSQLSKQLRRARSSQRKDALRRELSRLNNRIEREQERRELEQAKREAKQAEKHAVQHGKKPFFPKKRHIREKAQSLKYARLKKHGKLSKYLSRRQHRLAARERKRAPQRNPRSTDHKE